MLFQALLCKFLPLAARAPHLALGTAPFDPGHSIFFFFRVQLFLRTGYRIFIIVTCISCSTTQFSTSKVLSHPSQPLLERCLLAGCSISVPLPLRPFSLPLFFFDLVHLHSFFASVLPMRAVTRCLPGSFLYSWCVGTSSCNCTGMSFLAHPALLVRPETSGVATCTYQLLGAFHHQCSFVHSLPDRIQPPATARDFNQIIVVMAARPAVCQVTCQHPLTCFLGPP